MPLIIPKANVATSPHHLHGLGSRAALAACTVLARLRSIAASIIHAYICISARQGLLYIQCMLCHAGALRATSWYVSVVQRSFDPRITVITLPHHSPRTAYLSREAICKMAWLGLGDVLLRYRCRASGGSAGLLPASPRPVKLHSAGPSFKLPSCGCCASFACATAGAPLGWSTRTGRLRSADGCSSAPGLRLAERGRDRRDERSWEYSSHAGRCVSSHHPKYRLLFLAACPTHGHLNWILEIKKAAKGMTLHGGDLHAT